ncbi:uncharacterized protein FSUBG_10434 [Fusarium subglutinans]|uniref:Uncharacterized protein n=1 Tax=Gibberella subglutinans TaxID=42677 RepID=A0A8H5P7K0_GIBSU|nr:uncharacterized protein FSUBG_10434 [Fusarium subglutinans]KAF5591508.1 hypothetical protein FSUBG_10434 [Fusarium subglutinans]
MSLKRQGSDLDHGAKKMKSNDSNDNDGVSSTSSMPTSPALPRQPVTDLDDLPHTAREKINYVLQALGDVSPETLYQVNIMDQINAINCDGTSPPHFKYKTPPIDMMVGYEHSTFPNVLIYRLNKLTTSPGRTDAHDCAFIGCDRIVARVTTLRYADGYFTVEIKSRGRHTPKLTLPYGTKDDRRIFKEQSWEEGYRLKVQSLTRKAAVSHNREVLGWWVRRIVHSETRLTGREEARGEFLSGDVVLTKTSGDPILYFRR